MEKDNIYCIYRHISPNGKSYIGITKNIKHRWGNNGSGYKGQIKFWNAIKKYGWNNFEHEIIEDNLTFEQANVGEQLYIEIYDSVKNGYNISYGGDANGAHNNKIIIQLSSDMKILNIFSSESYCSKEVGFNSVTTIGNWCRDEKIHCGYYWRFATQLVDLNFNLNEIDCINYEYLNFDPYEDRNKKTIEAIIKANTGRSCVKIDQYTIDGKYIKTWDSLTSIYKELGGCDIPRAIKHNYNTKGYRWNYHDDKEKVITTNITKNKPVIQFDINHNFIKRYENTNEAEKETGIIKKNIARVCSGSRNTTGGFIWEWDDT